MKHLSFWLTLAAALGAVGILGGMTASAEETETPAAVPVATAAGGTWSVTENGSRCYYDAQGELATGEAEIDGISYLFDYSGAEKTGWRTVNGVRQYYDPETGALCSGWIEFGGNRYYTDPEQGKLTGEQWIGGSRYLLDETHGFQQTGRCTFSDGTVTYFLPDGSLGLGWQTDSGDTYYISAETEAALSGLQQIDGSLYYFAEDGRLLRSQSLVLDGVTYQAAADGRLTAEHTPITGQAQATAAQMAAYIRSVNPNVAQSVLDMIPHYLSEGAAEGIRGDIAFAQSCLETGNFAFRGSAVTLDQNNFCGMGVTQNGMKGNSFATPQLGIRAQIQHLKAYASTAPLQQACVDNRFRYVQRGCAPYVEWLGIPENPYHKGWAAGANYGAKILRILAAILQR